MVIYGLKFYFKKTCDILIHHPFLCKKIRLNWSLHRFLEGVGKRSLPTGVASSKALQEEGLSLPYALRSDNLVIGCSKHTKVQTWLTFVCLKHCFTKFHDLIKCVQKKYSIDLYEYPNSHFSGNIYIYYS